jgi:MFS family permease
MRLSPVPTISPKDIEQGKRALIHDGAWATVVGALGSGVILVGYTLELGASGQIIGLLAAIPFLTQLAQIPTIWLIERIRRRKMITIMATVIARMIVLSLAFLPLVGDTMLALGLVVAGHILLCVFGAVGGGAWNSWVHDLLPKQGLGDFFARRLFWSGSLSLIAGMFATGLVGRADMIFGAERKILVYSVLFALSAIAGFISAYWLTRVPEPAMRAHDDAAPRPRLHETLRTPLRDANFRRLIVFMVSWNFATNLAAPFIAVYLAQQVGLTLGFVIFLSVASQAANLLTIHWWGALSDRFSNKSVLAVCAPVFLACIVALPYTHTPEIHTLTRPMLVLIHLLMGAATAGVGLGTGAIGLKLARSGEGTAYLAAITLLGALAAGAAPILGGVLSQGMETWEMTALVHWGDGPNMIDIIAMRLRHWDFLFAFAFVWGLFALTRLHRVEEPGENADERLVIQEFMAMAGRSVRNLSTVGGLRGLTRLPTADLAADKRRPDA